MDQSAAVNENTMLTFWERYPLRTELILSRAQNCYFRGTILVGNTTRAEQGVSRGTLLLNPFSWSLALNRDEVHRT